MLTSNNQSNQYLRPDYLAPMTNPVSFSFEIIIQDDNACNIWIVLTQFIITYIYIYSINRGYIEIGKKFRPSNVLLILCINISIPTANLFFYYYLLSSLLSSCNICFYL